MEMQGASDLQHAVHQYVNKSAIHVEGHGFTPASQLMQQAISAGCQEASVVLRREEVVISAVELVPVSRSVTDRKALAVEAIQEKASLLARQELQGTLQSLLVMQSSVRCPWQDEGEQVALSAYGMCKAAGLLSALWSAPMPIVMPRPHHCSLSVGTGPASEGSPLIPAGGSRSRPG